jgi:hypothetical protein
MIIMTEETRGRYQTYHAFFDFYLLEHTKGSTRILHYIGSTLGLMSVLLAVIQAQPLWLLAGLISGYACAWIGHFVFEKNRPATFKYPLWSFIGDYHMYVLWLSGKLEPRRKRAALHHRL